MKKLYEYKSEIINTHHHIVDILRITEGGQDIHVGAHNFVLASRNSEDFENTTGIVIPLSEVKPLIQSLVPTAYGKDTALIGLNAHHIKVLIYSLELALDAHDGEIDPASQPYDLLEVLNTELNALIERNKQSKKDA